ncbi:MAG: sulfatase [Verrucomicrobiota bacterium]
MQTPKNIIWITTDHMRYDCIAANGNPAMHTPNLDRLARGGTSFDRCYTNNPLCMPSRCSFMTGCYPQQTGVMDNGQELPGDFKPTVGHCFAAGGYRTVQIGKLHFEGHEDHDMDPRARNSYGFDVFQLSEEPGCYEDAYRTWLRGEYPEHVSQFIVPRPMSDERKQERTTFKVLDAPWQASHSGWVATQACRYLGSWGNRKEPQFLHLGFYAPHPPLNPTRDMFAPYAQTEIPRPLLDEDDWNAQSDLDEKTLLEYRRHFFAMVTGVDLAVGKLLDMLENKGLLNDTLIIFSSDHGDACGDHGRTGKGDSFYDSIMHLPLVMHWPNGLKASAGRRIEGLVEMVDVLPTLLELAGLPVPRAMSGRSLAESLTTGKPVAGRDEVYAPHGPGHIMVRTEAHKYLRYIRGNDVQEVLYDLTNDPCEYRNEAENPVYADTLANMRERALARTIHASTSIREHRVRF